MTLQGYHTKKVRKGINIGFILFIVSEVFFFFSIFWAYFHSSLSPSVELGGMWPPMGIEALNLWELPLLNTVESAIYAVWVWTPLYMLNLSINQDYISLLLPLSLKKPQLNKLDTEFYKWFAGLTDAEGSFGIFTLPSKGIYLKFTLGFHIDDLPALKLIKNKLGFGRIYTYKKSCYYIITKKENILKVISIFDVYTLNSSKNLDFLDFKKAFYLYFERTNLTKELINQILELKNNMNTKRTNFKMSQVIISKSWLLGFIEGDGSFSLNRTTIEPIFSIQLTESQLPLLIEIKKYLEKNLGFDGYSIYKLNHTSIISIGKSKAVNNSKPMVSLTIKNIHVLTNYLIPFFSECQWITKKGLDFEDFKIICKSIYIGAYREKRIKDLIIKLSLTMNNNRLSTNLGTVEHLSTSERDEIIKAKATIEHLSDGRQIEIGTNKLIHRRSSSCIYELTKPSGEKLIKLNLAESAKELGVGFNTIKRQLNCQSMELGEVEYKGNKIKRIAVFYAMNK